MDGKQRRGSSEGVGSKRTKASIENKRRRRKRRVVRSTRRHKSKRTEKNVSRSSKVQQYSSKMSNTEETGARDRLASLRDAGMTALLSFFDSQTSLAIAVAKVQTYIGIDMNKEDNVNESILLATALLMIYRVYHFQIFNFE